MCYNSDLVHSIYSEYTQRDRPAGDGVGNTAYVTCTRLLAKLIQCQLDDVTIHVGPLTPNSHVIDQICRITT